MKTCVIVTFIMRWLARITALLITTTTIAVLFPASPIEATQSFDWSGGELVFGEEDPIDYTGARCSTQYLVPIGGPKSSRKGAVCVYDHGSWRYGIYQEKTGPDYAPRRNNHFVVGLGVSNYMYKVVNMPSDFLVDLANSQDIIHDYAVGMFTNNRQMRILKNFPSHLIPSIGVDETTYTVNDGTWEPVLSDGDGSLVTTKASGISENGRWLALEDGNLGLILKDLVTGELRLFSDYRHRYGVGSDASIKFTVSDNGNYIAMFDYNTTPTIYTITGNCGLVASDYSGLVGQYSRDSFNACTSDEGRLLEALQARYGMLAYRNVEAYAIEPSGGALYFMNCSWSEEDYQGLCSRLPLYAGGYVPQKKITYLALGDSYSSGEGDIGKKDDGSSYYLPGTDGNNQCHLSSRSYPFLLRDAWSIGADDMKSVACSGARVVPDYSGGDLNYLGQRDEMKGWDDYRRDAKRKQVVNDFSPGYIQQIEFVAKHRPEIITFTSGGNDVGFKDILEYCTGSYRILGVIPTADRCAYANDPQLRASLNRSIDEQYDRVSLFVDKLVEASPETEVYIVGYPQFISTPSQACGRYIALLDREERVMIRESVMRLNNVLKKVASNSGVAYVDVENSLDGGQICQGSKYMTGPLKLGAAKLIDGNVQEAYHPNSVGHEKIAEAILISYENALDYEIVSTVPEPSGFRIVRKTILSGFMSIGRSYVLKLVTDVFKPTTIVKLKMFSTPTELGTFTTLSDGSLEANVAIPNSVAIGKHLVTLTGDGVNGEPVQIQQFVYVTSGILDDIDGDGILDEDDECNFVAEWYVGDKNICSERDRLAYAPSSKEQKNNLQRSEQFAKQTYERSNEVAVQGDSENEADYLDSLERTSEELHATQETGNQENHDFMDRNKDGKSWVIAGIIIISIFGLGVVFHVIKKR